MTEKTTQQVWEIFSEKFFKSDIFKHIITNANEESKT